MKEPFLQSTNNRHERNKIAIHNRFFALRSLPWRGFQCRRLHSSRLTIIRRDNTSNTSRTLKSMTNTMERYHPTVL